MKRQFQRPFLASVLVVGLLALSLPAVSQYPEEPVVDRQALRGVITAWASAWQSQFVDDYLASYHPAFAPAGFTSKAVWASERRQRLSEPEWIRITLDGFEIINAAEDQATVAFWLHYARPGYADRTLKEVRLRQTGQDWLIEQELNREVQRMPAPE